MDSHKSVINGCQLIDIRRYSDNRGYLSVIENNIDVPFEIKRIYYLYMVPEVARGAHAHKELRQLLIATSGSVEVIMDNGTDKKSFILNRDRLHDYLDANGVGSVIHYPIAPHEQECYVNESWNTPKLSLPITERLANEELSIPMSPCLTIEQAEYVVNLINEFK